MRDDPEPESFAQWLLAQSVALNGEMQSSGAVAVMARDVYGEWRWANRQVAFRDWLADGAPSEDAFEEQKP